MKRVIESPRLGSCIKITTDGIDFFELSRGRFEKPASRVESISCVGTHKTDPLLGTPHNEEHGIRYYRLRSELPKIDHILSLDMIESVEILSVTSYILMLDHWVSIESAVNRGVKMTFLILDPQDSSSVNVQKQIYRGKDIKQQIKTSIRDLCKIKKGLTGGMKKNLMIFTYKGILRLGVMIVKFKDNDNSWLKIERFTVGQDANTLPSEAAYYHDNPKFVVQHSNAYNQYLNARTTKEISC